MPHVVVVAVVAVVVAVVRAVSRVARAANGAIAAVAGLAVVFFPSLFPTLFFCCFLFPRRWWVPNGNGKNIIGVCGHVALLLFGLLGQRTIAGIDTNAQCCCDVDNCTGVCVQHIVSGLLPTESMHVFQMQTICDFVAPLVNGVQWFTFMSHLYPGFGLHVVFFVPFWFDVSTHHRLGWVQWSTGLTQHRWWGSSDGLVLFDLPWCPVHDFTFVVQIIVPYTGRFGLFFHGFHAVAIATPPWSGPNDTPNKRTPVRTTNTNNTGVVGIGAYIGDMGTVPAMFKIRG